MTRLFACLFILLLGGCGMAVSEKPMFAAADAAGAPTFADGVWLMKDDPACRVDAAAPVSRWPGCAHWVEHRGGRWSEPSGGTAPMVKPLENDILFVGGKIALMQVGFKDGGTEWDGPTYMFMAFDNPAGGDKLKAIALWPVMCGTMVDYKTAAEQRNAMPVVKKRFPGFDEQCRPASQDALRAAAAPSRPHPAKMLRFQWIRERLD